MHEIVKFNNAENIVLNWRMHYYASWNVRCGFDRQI